MPPKKKSSSPTFQPQFQQSSTASFQEVIHRQTVRRVGTLRAHNLKLAAEMRDLLATVDAEKVQRK
jgi:hypothetical protein